jgi:hypothetical protein
VSGVIRNISNGLSITRRSYQAFIQDDIISVNHENYGIMVCRNETTGGTAILNLNDFYHTSIIYSFNDGISTIKDTEGSVNIYFEHEVIKIQNKMSQTVWFKYSIL